jgi:hypothetical protein
LVTEQLVVDIDDTVGVPTVNSKQTHLEILLELHVLPPLLLTPSPEGR